MMRTVLYRKVFLAVLTAMGLSLATQRAEAMGEVGTPLAFPAGTAGIESGVIDSSGTFMYFGSTTTALATVFKVRTTDFVIVSTLTLTTPNAGAHFSLMDPTTDYLYVASSGTPGVITQINLDSFVEVDSVTLPTGYAIASALVDPDGFGYFAVNSSSNLVVVVYLPLMVVVDEILLDATDGPLSAGALDPVNFRAYFGTRSSPAKVVKVDLLLWVKEDTVPLASSHNDIASVILSTTSRRAFLGSRSSTGRIFRLDLQSFAELLPALDVSAAGVLTTAVADPPNNLGYFGSMTSPGVIIRVDMAASSITATTTLTLGEDNLMCSVIDIDRQFAYFGTRTSAGMVVKVDLNDIQTGPPIILTHPSSQNANPGGTAFFAISAAGSTPFTYQWFRNGVAIGGATASNYTTPPVSFADDNSYYQCSVTNALGSAMSRSGTLTVLPIVKAYPNPWRSDRHSPPMYFQGVPPNATLKIFTLSMHWVKSIQGTDPLQWDLTNDAGQPVASGFYFYVVTTGNDLQTVTGKIAVIR